MRRKEPADGTTYEGNDMYEGYCADLAKMISEFVGFNYLIRPVKDAKYGAQEDNVWNGMVGELVRHVSWNIRTSEEADHGFIINKWCESFTTAL